MNKVENNKAWFLVLPVVLLVAFSAIVPLMTVVNYSVQDIFDQNTAYFVGAEWYREILQDSRLQARHKNTGGSAHSTANRGGRSNFGAHGHARSTQYRRMHMYAEDEERTKGGRREDEERTKRGRREDGE